MKDYIETQTDITKSNLKEIENHSIKEAHRYRQNNAMDFFEKYALKDYPILDIGCRDGGYMKILIKRGFLEILGIDCSEEAIDIAQKQGYFCIVGDAHSLSKKCRYNFFGTVLASHVLEHCHDVNKVIDEIYRVLMINGRLLIEIPLEKIPDSIPTIWGHYTTFQSPNDFKNLIDNRFKFIDERLDNIKNKWYRVVYEKCI